MFSACLSLVQFGAEPHADATNRLPGPRQEEGGVRGHVPPIVHRDLVLLSIPLAGPFPPGRQIEHMEAEANLARLLG